MSSGMPSPGDGEGARLGGARADFVASLGRKVASARELLAALEGDPASPLLRDELRRRLHALGSGARLLHFEAMTRSIQEALTVLDRAAQHRELQQSDIVVAARVLDDLPALAWDEVNVEQRRSAAPTEVPLPTVHSPIAVLVVGDESLAQALVQNEGLGGRALECEHSGDVRSALQLARAYAPDLLLVDADLAGAAKLVEALLDDPLTEPVPIVIVGTFSDPEDQARLLALGVAKTLPKPASPEVVRGTCEEVLESRDGRTLRLTLGEPTLEQLAERLSDELRRALVESVDTVSRSLRVPLGEGTEVLGALWGAIARVQQLVSEKTGGAIRFGGDAPEGTIALAPSLHQELPGADRMSGRRRTEVAHVRMNGRRVVVADDDPGVTWFISDLLRTAGCEVFEALDGNTALKWTLRTEPDLVVSDILMPGLDGFGLSRALRRDVAVRGTPVILLSWKEDLLQRVHELGASAAAYMRKEADSRAILARVREVLRPRARIEMRLRSESEVRGRLDGLSPRLLLHLVCAIRKNARLAVRDAAFLYEIDIRGGSPCKATRTASDGSYQSGERVLASLLGVGAGRFVVNSVSDPVRADLSGTLFEQLAGPISAARGALAAATGAQIALVERIGIDPAGLQDYLLATPDPARALIRRLADGASPRRMLFEGEIAPSLFEDVLSDLAIRGAIIAVEGAHGADFLGPAVEAARAMISHTATGDSQAPMSATPSAVPPLAVLTSEAASRAAQLARSRATQQRSGHPLARYEPDPRDESSGLLVSFDESAPAPQTTSGPPSLAEDDGAPSSLEDAVMREISDRSPSPRAARPTPQLPPIVEPSALRPRSSNPPAESEGTQLPSIPPDAVVPETTSVETAVVEAVASVVAAEPPALTPPLPMPADAGAPSSETVPLSLGRRKGAALTAPLNQALEEGGGEALPTKMTPAPAPESETAPESVANPFAPTRMMPKATVPFAPTRLMPRSTHGATAPTDPPARQARKSRWGAVLVAFIILGLAVTAALLVAQSGAQSPTAAPLPSASAPGAQERPSTTP